MAEENPGQRIILPPKIDLRKNGFLKPMAPPSKATMPATAPVAAPAPAFVRVQPAAPKPILSATQPVMAQASLRPAIKVTAPAPAAPLLSAPQPIPAVTAARPAPAPTAMRPAQPFIRPPAVAPQMAMKPPVPIGAPKLTPVAPVLSPRPAIVPPGITPATPTAPAPKKETSKIPLEMASHPAPAARPAILAPAATAEARTVLSPKRETSKIPLEMAKAVTPGQQPPEGPKTIRIKPATAVSTVRIGAAAPRPVMPGAVDEKRKTSRISLEAAFSTDAAKATNGPKTIKLKRPTEAATIKVAPKGEAPKPAAGVPASDALNKTAQLDIPPEEEGATPTKRKTVRIKRPEGREHREAVSIARAEAEPSREEQTTAVSEDIGWLAPVFSIVTILIVAALIYFILAAGPLSRVWDGWL